jgi:hypothetical protein
LREKKNGTEKRHEKRGTGGEKEAEDVYFTVIIYSTANRELCCILLVMKK